MEELSRQERVERCLELMQEGTSIRKSASYLNLSETTMRRHLKAVRENTTVRPVGASPSLRDCLETEIASIVKCAAESGFGISREELQDFVGDVEERKWRRKLILATT